MAYSHRNRIMGLQGIIEFIESDMTPTDFRNAAKAILEEDPKSSRIFSRYAHKLENNGPEKTKEEIQELIDYLNKPAVQRRIQSSIALANEIAGKAGREPEGSDLSISRKLQL